MNIKQWLISTTLLALAFSPTWGEAPSRLSDEEKREDAARVLETSQGIIKIVIFETLYQETPRETGPNYAQIYRRGIVVESLRGPFKVGDYIVLHHSFEGYPRGMGNIRQETPHPKGRYYTFSKDDIQPARKDFTGIFTVLNNAPILEEIRPFLREQYIPDVATIEPARLIMKPREKTGEK